MNTMQKEPWVGRSLALLDRSVETLDAATLSRLGRARRAALAQRHRPAWTQGWLLGSGFAGAALVLAIGWGVAGHSGRVHAPAHAVVTDADSAESVGADDGQDLYENLDFYVWLDAEQQGQDD